jgi:hypothetical protein
MADRNHSPRTVASITRNGRGPQHHRCDDPGLSPKEFLYAIMHDPTFQLSIRIDAAKALLSITASIPRPINHHIGCKIVIGGIPSEDLGPCDKSGCEPRTPGQNSVAEAPEQINGNSQSFPRGRLNNPHPQSGPVAPVNIETNSHPPTLIDYSTPPTPDEIQQIKAAINKLRPNLAHLPIPEPHLCACGHWIFGPCPLGERCCDRTKLN